MASEHPGYRFFILGAGFSVPAGLPLGSDLFRCVKSQIEFQHGRNTKFQRDLENYIEYKKICDGIELSENDIDLEDLMSFLDMEHFLGLRGSDTWSDEGNESQLMIRNGIGKIIQDRTPDKRNFPDFYYNFAKNLSPNDIIITFNYDIILENSLDLIGKPYRLFPNRFKNIGLATNTINNDIEEVIILKMHGSVDWFSDSEFLSSKQTFTEMGIDQQPKHPVFGAPGRYEAIPLVDGPRPTDDPLLHIHRIRKIEKYYSENNGLTAPFILSPSHVKFVYISPLNSFWSGLGQSGGLNLGVSVIGFSLPKHDEYIRIALYNLISNYQKFEWNTEFFGVKKNNIKMVDYRTNEKSISEYRNRYSFIDSEKSEFMFDGFGEKAIDFIFKQSRNS